jgi:hypothetical protein
VQSSQIALLDISGGYWQPITLTGLDSKCERRRGEVPHTCQKASNYAMAKKELE